MGWDLKILTPSTLHGRECLQQERPQVGAWLSLIGLIAPNDRLSIFLSRSLLSVSSIGNWPVTIW